MRAPGSAALAPPTMVHHVLVAQQLNDEHGFVKAYVTGWLGHGNPEGPIWFVGSEEKRTEKWDLRQIAEEWSKQGRRAISSSGDRTGFEKSSQTYNGLIQMMPEAQLMPEPGRERQSFLDEFRKNRLCAPNCDHALLEASPTPRRSSADIESPTYPLNEYQEVVASI